MHSPNVPTLFSSTPSDGATGVLATANIVLTFSQAVYVQSGNIVLYKTSDDSLVETFDVTGSKVTGTGTKTITINPATTLSSATGYFLNIASTAFDGISGGSYAGITNATSLNFTTADVNAPTLSSSSPADGATDVALDANIVLTFSEAVDVESGNIVIKKTSDDSTVETIAVTNSKVTGTGTTEITINPTADLASGTGYYLNIASTAFDNSLGFSYAGITNATSLNFTTAGEAPDLLPSLEDLKLRIAAGYDVTGYDTSGITNMSALFSGNTTFNQDISGWDVSNVTSMGGMFSWASAFNQDISSWDVSNVYNMLAMFHEATAFNGDISSWDVSNVSSMNFMFHGASSFNQPLDSWNVSRVEEMRSMFSYASEFNQPLDSWDVSYVEGMDEMFKNSTSFNQDLNSWDVSYVGQYGYGMSSMFHDATSFNGDISSWDVWQVINMEDMFHGAAAFNQDIGSWGVSLDSMQNMFSGAVSFDQDIGSWNVSRVRNMKEMFNGVTLSRVNYDALLVAWNALDLQDDVIFDGGNSIYTADTAPSAARANMIATYGWTITDGGSVVDVDAPTLSSSSTGGVNDNIILTFNEAVYVESGNIVIKRSLDDSIVETIDVTGSLVTGTGTTTITINLTDNLDSSTGYYLNIDATAFDDSSGNSYAGITNSTTVNFTTIGSDTTAPTLNFDPVDSATGVAFYTNITLTFSEGIRNTDNSVVTNSNVGSLITLKDTNASGSDIRFTATIDTAKRVITIIPASSFPSEQDVYVAIGATLEDASGNAISANSVTFTIVDYVTPALSSSSPADGAVGIAVDANIVLTFNEEVDVENGDIVIRKTLDDSVIETIDVTGSLVTGTGTTTITINPSATLDSATGYYLTIASTAFDDTSGNSYAGITNATTLSFTTFDPTDVEGRVTDLEAIDHTHFDPTTIQGRVTTLEEINQEQFDSSNDALSLGEGADTGDNTKVVAIGRGAKVTGNAATAIGNLAEASLGGIALGNNAIAGNLAVAIGNKSRAAGSCLAFGDKTDSGSPTASKCVAIGASAEAKKSYEIRLGGEIADYDDDGNVTKLWGRGFVTVHPNKAGLETLDNELVSKKWVDSLIKGIMRYRGDWYNSFTYYKGEVVKYDGSVYLCTSSNLNTVTPEENTNHWTQI